MAELASGDRLAVEPWREHVFVHVREARYGKASAALLPAEVVWLALELARQLPPPELITLTNALREILLSSTEVKHG